MRKYDEFQHYMYNLGETNMVICSDKQEIKKFIKWLYRRYYVVKNINTNLEPYLFEESALNLVNNYWSETH